MAKCPPTQQDRRDHRKIEVRAGDKMAMLDPFHFCWDTPEGGMCVYGLPPEPLPDLATINNGVDITFPVEGFTFHADFTPVPPPDCAAADCESAWLGNVEQTGPTSWRVMPPQLPGGWTVRLRGSGPAGDVFVEFAAETSLPVLSVEQVVADGFEGLVTVVGHLVASADQPIRICSALMESFPPQCASPSLVVAGFDFESLPGWSATGGDPTASNVTWTDTPVEITGRIDTGVLTVQGSAPPISETTDVGGDDPNTPTPMTIHRPLDGMYTVDQVVTITGSSSWLAMVYFGDTAVGTDGPFEGPVTLEPGVNTIDVRLVDYDGAEYSQTLMLTYVPEALRQFAFVTAVDGNRIVVDYADFLTGEDARQAAVEAGEIGEGEELPNNFFIRNINPQLRTFSLTDDTGVWLLRFDEEGTPQTARVAIADLPAIFTDPDPTEWYGAGRANLPSWLIIQGDVILQIEEQYLP
jgi:hypothetical protein